MGLIWVCWAEGRLGTIVWMPQALERRPRFSKEEGLLDLFLTLGSAIEQLQVCDAGGSSAAGNSGAGGI